MENEVLKEVFIAIYNATTNGKSLEIDDAYLDEDENCVVIQRDDEEYKLTIQKV